MIRQASQGGPSRLRTLLWASAASLLLIPAVAMRITDEVRWDAADFLFAAGMIAAAGIALELLVRRTGGPAYKVAAIVAVLAVFAVTWINVAVGIIGEEGEPAGWVFVGVVAMIAAAVTFSLSRARA